MRPALAVYHAHMLMHKKPCYLPCVNHVDSHRALLGVEVERMAASRSCGHAAAFVHHVTPCRKLSMTGWLYANALLSFDLIAPVLAVSFGMADGTVDVSSVDCCY